MPPSTHEYFEIWKEYDSNYAVSDQGRILSIRNSKILSQFPDSDGYLQITLYSKTIKVHKLVALLFLEQQSAFTINHKNGVKTDNRAENLEWMTPAENNKHAGLMGLMAKGREVHTAKLAEEDVVKIKQLFVEYNLGDREIGRLFGVNECTIGNIRRKKSWKHVCPDLNFKSSGPMARGMFAKKLHGEDIPIIRQMSKEGVDNITIGNKFKVSPATIAGILSGKNLEALLINAWQALVRINESY